MSVRIFGMRGKRPADFTDPEVVVNCTSGASKEWERQLSPFFLGPCQLYDNFMSRTMENAWQYAKVYSRHLSEYSAASEYWTWAQQGWANPRAVRFPMGRGAKPEFVFFIMNAENDSLCRSSVISPRYRDKFSV